MVSPDNQIIVIFGGRGDLAMRKIVPAIYALHKQGLLPERYAVLATGRSKVSDDAYRGEVENALKEAKAIDGESGKEFLSSFYYADLDPSVLSDYNRLPDKLEVIRHKTRTGGNTLFYLSLPPDLYNVIPRYLALQGLNNEGDGWKRMIIEKPFGYDY